VLFVTAESSIVGALTEVLRRNIVEHVDRNSIAVPVIYSETHALLDEQSPSFVNPEEL
jgi:hypothetical protein